jgi:hypothetical protein
LCFYSSPLPPIPASFSITKTPAQLETCR